MSKVDKDMSRSRAYTREVRNKAIRRKKRICEDVYYPSISSWYPHDGQYSKGKIHCSCPICTYEKYYKLPSLKDEREKEKSVFALKEYENDNFNL